MASLNVTGQEMDEGLEEMWTSSSDGISSIDPGECFLSCMDTFGLTHVRVISSPAFLNIKNQLFPERKSEV
jgi:hypothetical protein